MSSQSTQSHFSSPDMTSFLIFLYSIPPMGQYLQNVNFKNADKCDINSDLIETLGRSQSKEKDTRVSFSKDTLSWILASQHQYFHYLQIKDWEQFFPLN